MTHLQLVTPADSAVEAEIRRAQRPPAADPDFPELDVADTLLPTRGARPRYGPFDLLTKAEMADFFGCCERSIEREQLPSTRVGGKVVYPWAEVVKALQLRAKGGR